MLQHLLLVLGVACGCYASESPLPRCSDQVCAKDPHCVYHRGRSVCWSVEDAADEGGTCRCCQNCIAGTNVFIDEECHSAIQGCQTSECPKVKCTYGSYIPLCDCCQSCISIDCKPEDRDEYWPNCAAVSCAACPEGTTPISSPCRCCNACVKPQS
ncbi:keratin-associated protein 5-4 [Ixodes scapularis]|uniref:keratin-associated protein 5-4 n=1 Tax=Ixodes scapularis TaxID=6945 RepID=UPI001A9D5CEA|nr:keratin-associated protein 5-4 [Ixodes scapularis]